jgi:small subunit ribosomal protein S8
MSLNSQLATMLSIIQNGQRAHLEMVSVKRNKFSLPILGLLYKEGLISGYSLEKEGSFIKDQIWLKYSQGKPVIRELKCISKPGKPVYKTVEELKLYKDVSTLYVVSTVRGLINLQEALKESLGGVLICKISQ